MKSVVATERMTLRSRLDGLSQRIDSLWTIIIPAVIGFGVIFLMAPLVIVVLTSFNESAVHFPPEGFTFDAYGHMSDRFFETFRTSIRLAVYTSAIALIFALPASIGLARGWFPGRAIFEAFLRSPVQLPGIVLGLSFYQYYVFLFDSFGIGLRGEFIGLVIAHAVLITPYMLTLMVARAASLPTSYEEAAYGLGAGPVRTTVSVTLPLMRPAILAGLILAFVISFENVPLSLFLAVPDATPLPVFMLGSAEEGLKPVLYAEATVVMIFSAVLAMIVERFVGLRTVMSV